MRRLLHAQDGAGTTEVVIVTPLLLLLIFGIIQLALAEHAQHAAQAAATQALAVARTQTGTTAAGQAQADTVLAGLGSALSDPRVSITRTATDTTVTITGGAQTVIPGLHLSVKATVSGPNEEWTPG